MSDLDDRYSPGAHIERLKAQVAGLESDVRRANEAARLSAEVAAKPCERLLLYEPVVKAAKDVVKSYILDDQEKGTEACIRLTVTVGNLPPEPS